MKRILDEIQTGKFAREFVLENQAGAPSIKAMRRISQAHQIEQVGEQLARDDAVDSRETAGGPREELSEVTL